MQTCSCAKPIVVALVGQPNCGKSTLFNAVGGFQVVTANFPGTSVTYAQTPLCFNHHPIQLINLPGTYSISSYDLAEKVARDFLLSGKADVVLNIVDTSLLSRSLELTLQLIEMRIPLVLGLNMADEARRKGIDIDLEKLGRLLGVPVVQLVAVQGTGINELFQAAIDAVEIPRNAVQPVYDREVEACIKGLLSHYPSALTKSIPCNSRFVTLRLLEMDEEFERTVSDIDAPYAARVAQSRKQLADVHAWPESGVLGSHRHALVLDLYEQVASHHRGSHERFSERLDRRIMHPVGGFLMAAGSLLFMFWTAFVLGDFVSKILEAPFRGLHNTIAQLGSSAFTALLSGLAQGIEAGAGIVLPYLVPLLLVLALYEDTGLLPRIAFLVDGLLHKVGLHGKSVVPIILGYGCNVPAIMSTRNLENPRDRMITLLVIPFVTCSARSAIILALVGKSMGALWAAAVYFLSVFIAAVLSFLLSRFRKEESMGLIMEVPPLRRPFFHIVIKKLWLRIREFFIYAWPVIALSSAALALFTHFGWDRHLNAMLAPITQGILRLPAEAGISLFLGVFKKELTLTMLFSAFNTNDLTTVLSQEQLLVLVVFAILYVPCVATLTALWKEGGWKMAAASAVLNFSIALLVAGLLAAASHIVLA